MYITEVNYIKVYCDDTIDVILQLIKNDFTYKNYIRCDDEHPNEWSNFEIEYDHFKYFYQSLPLLQKLVRCNFVRIQSENL